METIRETIELGDFEELDDYVEDIREQVKTDPEFQELFGEIKSKNYGDVLSLIDEFIYQDIQSEADQFLNEEALQKLSSLDSGLDLALTAEEPLSEDITFEEFDDESFAAVSGQDEDS